MARVVGIDLGTANSVVAVLEEGRPRVVTNVEGSRATPSVVAFTAEGEVLVGEAARRQTVTNAGRTVRAVRRRTGTDWAIRIDGESYTAQRITVLLLRKLKRDAEASVGEELTDAVITVPASFGEAQREETREAGRLAGFNVLRVVSESSLAGLGHAVGNGGRDQTVLVVRCGAGSFDASLLEIDGAGGVIGAVVKAVCGDDNLGGDDWDRAVADELAARFNSLHGIDLTRDETAAARLREAAEQARIDLSSASESTVELAYAAVTAEGPVHLHERLTRDRLGQLMRGPLKRCEVLLRGLLKDSGLALGDIDQVVLIGGATRMPAFVDLLRELTGGKEPTRSADADGLAAAGAVLQAGLLKGVRRDILLADAVALDLGVETQRGVMTPMVRRSHQLGTRRDEMFTLTGKIPADGRPPVIRLWQGMNPVAAENKQLGVIELAGLRTAGGRVPQIKVTCEADHNGIAHATAKDVASGQEWRMVRGSSVPPGARVLALAVEPHESAPRGRLWSPGTVPVSQEVRATAEREKLGNHRGGYGAAGSRLGDRVGLAFFTIFCLLLAVLGIGPGGTLLTIISVPGALAFGWWFVSLQRQAARYTSRYAQLHMFEHGLIIVNKAGKAAAHGWDTITVYQSNVAHYVEGRYIRTTHDYPLTRTDGSELLPSDAVTHAKEWGPAVQQAVTEAKLPGELAAIRRGETLEFAGIKLSREAVEARGRAVPWSRIERVTLVNGSVGFHVRDEKGLLISTPVGGIPDFFVFHEIAKRLQAPNRYPGQGCFKVC
ncbi:DUF6585 family protein [Streptomyces sp. 21So2-11]|uniref:DUF6585 family protein n=1 Tax=Streptomyces sp. 21So2-11 TaxID=3144408 RepID=UPI00321C14AF